MKNESLIEQLQSEAAANFYLESKLDEATQLLSKCNDVLDNGALRREVTAFLRTCPACTVARDPL